MKSSSDLSKFNNKSYNPGSILRRFLWYFVNIIFFKSSIFPFNFIKVFFLKFFGARVGKGVVVKPNVNIKYPWKLNIGNYVWIGENVWIDNLGKVIIENNVCISQGALLLCGNHNYKKSEFNLIVSEIIIKNGAWVGAKSIVCPGVIVDNHSVLSVGSVATQNTEPYSIYQGNPAKKIKNRVIK